MADINEALKRTAPDLIVDVAQPERVAEETEARSEDALERSRPAVRLV